MANNGDTGQRILVVDDSPYISRIVRIALERAGFDVVTAHSGEAGLAVIQKTGLPHLAVVDIEMEPGMDGFKFCEHIHQYSDLPVIMLTALQEENVILRAIEQYAEDYMTKPFNPRELVARVRRVLRRIGDFTYTLDPVTKVDKHLSVDFHNCNVFVDGETNSLTPTETKLLYLLMRNAEKKVSTEFLLRRLWPLETAYEDRLRVYIHRLRRKLDPQKTKRHQYVVSVRNYGYRFCAMQNEA